MAEEQAPDFCGMTRNKNELEEKVKHYEEHYREHVQHEPEVVDHDKYFDENGTFDHMLFAADMLREHHFLTMKDDGTVHVYDSEKGIYVPYGEQLIKQKMATRLKERNKHRYYADIIHHIKGKTFFDRPRTINPNRIVLLNGIFDLATKQLSPFNPEEFHLAQTPVTYDLQAECPAIAKFLTEVVGEKQLSLVQEVFGCCLLRDHPYHLAFMLVGDGKNWKTTLQNLLNAFLGKENVSHETLQELCYNRFSKAQLYGKLANTCADIPDTPLTQTGTFKMLTGNDPISAEYKFKNPFTFTNHAKLIFSCNKVPETKDDTDAYFRRWKIIPCNNVFTGEKCDPKILDKLTTPQELSGLFHWALEGLKRLIEKGEFSGNEDIEEQRRQYIRKSNSSKAYIEERLQYDPNDKAIIPEAELCQKYIQFCNENGLPTSKKAILTQNIHQYLPKARQTTARIDEKAGVHIWQHIRLVASVAGEYTREGNDLPEFLDLSGRVATPATKVLRVPPAEPCEACHSLAVEWELVSENGIMRVCNSCFNQLRKRGKPFEFLEDDDES